MHAESKYSFFEFESKTQEKDGLALEEKIYQQKQLLTLTPEEIIQLYQNKNLIGVYNIETKLITLFPSMKDLAWLELDTETGCYVRAWEATKNFMGASAKGPELPTDELKRFNNMVELPRAVSVIGKFKEKYNCYSRPHTYLLNLMGEIHNRHLYRGFSVIPSLVSPSKTKFVWNSISLNSKSSIPYFKDMEKNYQLKIVDIFEDIFKKLNKNYRNEFSK